MLCAWIIRDHGNEFIKRNATGKETETGKLCEERPFPYVVSL
uniref:Uncharacterized protein MANES_08G087300 n=1 Tax=Rhizophora mucronata TaxID=61149 RepID=A0A2P2J9K9_RHIMU